MAEGLYLVSRAAGDEGNPVINGVVAVVINKDSAQTNAQIIASAVAKCESANDAGNTPVASRPNVFPSDYFDTVTAISDLAAGPLADDTDAVIIGGVTGSGDPSVVWANT